MNAFWKDVSPIHRSNVTLPCSIEGVSGAENIAELWRQHYTTLFNCVKSEPGLDIIPQIISLVLRLTIVLICVYML